MMKFGMLFLGLAASASAKSLVDTSVSVGSIGDMTVNLAATGAADKATGTATLKVNAANVLEVGATGSFSKDTSGTGAEFKMASTLKFAAAVASPVNAFCTGMSTIVGFPDICGDAGYDSSTNTMTFTEFTKTISRRQLDDLEHGRQLTASSPSVSVQEMAAGMGGQAKMAGAFLKAFGIDVSFELSGLTFDGADAKMPVSFNVAVKLKVMDWDTHNLLDAYNVAMDGDLSATADYCCMGSGCSATKCTLRTAINTLDGAACSTMFTTLGGSDKSLWTQDFDMLKEMNTARRMRGRSLAMTLPAGVTIDSDGKLTAELYTPPPAASTDDDASGSASGSATTPAAEEEGGGSTVIIIVVLLLVVGGAAGFAYKKKQQGGK